MRPTQPVLAVFLLLLAAPACRAQNAESVVLTREGTIDVKAEDAAMNRAMARARATLPIFNSYLPGAAGGRVQAVLKAQFQQGDVIEHMWVSDVTFTGGVYRGRLINRPRELTNVAQGNAVNVSPKHVSDWLVVEEGVGLGNFTMLELRRRMTPADRAEFDGSRHYRIIADTALIALPRGQ